MEVAVEISALAELVKQGLLPEEPYVDPKDCSVLCVERTYGSAPDGRTYRAAVIGYPDFLGNNTWTVSGGAPNTPRNVSWAEFLVWLTSPSKSKWKIWEAMSFEELANSRPLNHQLYATGG